MKKWKIISGIISILFFAMLLFSGYNMSQYGMDYDVLYYFEEGMNQAKMSFFMLPAGIVSIITNKGNLGGDIALVILYSLGAILGLFGHGSFLAIIVGIWCGICAIVAIISLIKNINQYV